MGKKNFILLSCICVFSQIVSAQIHISVATDISVQRSLKKDQRFWTFGQDVVFNWHLSPRSGPYASLSYFTNGNFKNQLSATAKSSTTSPQQMFFTNSAQVRLEQVSLGWRYYFVGANDAEIRWNLYGLAGYGLIFGKAVNVYSRPIDTSLYEGPQQPLNGSGHFKRLTLDLGLGWEVPLGGDLCFYAEGKIWIPTTEYPSKYLFVNNNAPLVIMATAGLRIPF